MNSIVVNPKDPQELEFIAELLKKLGIESVLLSEEDKEDIGLSILMRDADRKDTVTEEEVMSKLKG